MEAYRSPRTILCAYECLRLAFIIGAFVMLEPMGTAAFPWLALAAPGALFPLIALFWRISLGRYRAYAPLFIAGKSLCVLSTVFWLFIEKGSIMRELFLDVAPLLIPGVMFFLIIGDLLAVWLAAAIMQSSRGGGA